MFQIILRQTDIQIPNYPIDPEFLRKLKELIPLLITDLNDLLLHKSEFNDRISLLKELYKRLTKFTDPLVMVGESYEGNPQPFRTDFDIGRAIIPELYALDCLHLVLVDLINRVGFDKDINDASVEEIVEFINRKFTSWFEAHISDLKLIITNEVFLNQSLKIYDEMVDKLKDYLSDLLS